MKRPSFISLEELNFFHQNAYLIVRNLYSTEEIDLMRSVFDDWFKRQIWKQCKYDSEHIINDIYSHCPALANLIFKSDYFEAIKDLLGESIVWLPECAIHRNRYVDWHRDTSSAERDGLLFKIPTRNVCCKQLFVFRTMGYKAED